MRFASIVIKASKALLVGFALSGTYKAFLTTPTPSAEADELEVQHVEELPNSPTPAQSRCDADWQPKDDYDKFQLSRDSMIEGQQPSQLYECKSQDSIVDSVVRAMEEWTARQQLCAITPLSNVTSLSSPSYTTFFAREDRRASEFASGLLMGVSFDVPKHSLPSLQEVCGERSTRSELPRTTKIECVMAEHSMSCTEEDMFAALAASWFAPETPMDCITLPKRGERRDWEAAAVGVVVGSGAIAKAKSIEPKAPEFEPPSRNEGQEPKKPREEYMTCGDDGERERRVDLGCAPMSPAPTRAQELPKHGTVQIGGDDSSIRYNKSMKTSSIVSLSLAAPTFCPTTQQAPVTTIAETSIAANPFAKDVNNKKDPINSDSTYAPVGVSPGVSCTSSDNDNVSELLSHPDVAGRKRSELLGMQQKDFRWIGHLKYWGMCEVVTKCTSQYFLLEQNELDRVVGMCKEDKNKFFIGCFADHALVQYKLEDGCPFSYMFMTCEYALEEFASFSKAHYSYQDYASLLTQASLRMDPKEFQQLCSSNGLDEKQRAMLTLPSNEEYPRGMQEDPKDVRGR